MQRLHSLGSRVHGGANLTLRQQEPTELRVLVCVSPEHRVQGLGLRLVQSLRLGSRNPPSSMCSRKMSQARV